MACIGLPLPMTTSKQLCTNTSTLSTVTKRQERCLSGACRGGVPLRHRRVCSVHLADAAAVSIASMRLVRLSLAGCGTRSEEGRTLTARAECGRQREPTSTLCLRTEQLHFSTISNNLHEELVVYILLRLSFFEVPSYDH
ncbi:unnamed protein product, partial [Brenthis ino]